jgi:hypothetical protein
MMGRKEYLYLRYSEIEKKFIHHRLAFKNKNIWLKKLCREMGL